ncbi:cysteine hydrolase family protein [Microbacterium sp. JZ31]|uniref:cysteine hydrolase family protein n=1 Tax=Microbacterium sp. JZ31 TaxID=1906274 RepID=UPI0019314833|nr:cysteine hydrolase family protein [Microbacterium sp. JZ31]
MTTALVVIDMQQGFLDPSWGPTTNHPQCEDNVARLIGHWRTQGDPLVVVRHDSVNSSSPLHPGAPGNALVDVVAATTPDLLVTKTVNSAFYGEPDLAAWLREARLSRIVLCGIQTNMCVETTARMGGNLGFDVVVALDATRTFDLAGPDGAVTPADALMAATATNLHGGGFATIASTADLIGATA